MPAAVSEPLFWRVPGSLPLAGFRRQEVSMSRSQVSRRGFLTSAGVLPALAALPTLPLVSVGPPKQGPACQDLPERQAEELQRLTGNRVEAHFEDCLVGNDDSSLGHAFIVYPCHTENADAFDEIVLDDRKPMAPQLAAELRRVGLEYLKVARKVEAAVAGRVC